MRGLQIRMDSARQASFASRSPAYGHYESRPHIEVNNTGLEASVTVASSPQYEETIYHEPSMQLQSQPSIHAPNIACVSSLPGPQPQRPFAELRRSDLSYGCSAYSAGLSSDTATASISCCTACAVLCATPTPSISQLLYHLRQPHCSHNSNI